MLGIVIDRLWFKFRVKLAVLDGGIGGGGRRCNVDELVSFDNDDGGRRCNVDELPSLDRPGWRRCSVNVPASLGRVGGSLDSMYDQLVTAVAGAGSSDPFDDFDVDNVDGAAAAVPRLLEVVFDLGRKTRRSEAVAPFLSLDADVEIRAPDADAVVTVVDEDAVRAAADVIVTVEGVAGGDVDVEADADDLRRKRFIFYPSVFDSSSSHSMSSKF